MDRTAARRIRLAIPATLALSAALAAGMISCSEATAPEPSTVFGPAASMGNGTGRTYVVIDPSGAPTSVGVRFSEAALASLPAGTTMVDYTFALPAEGSLTPYTHVVIGWNPMGHPPAVYQAAHLDVHFYQVTPAQRDAMVPSDPQFNAKLATQPAAMFIPTSYVLTPGGVPRMGAHWIDTTAPEANGQPFTSTFIYGSYDGAFIFAEPMIATSFLSTHPSFTAPIKLPSSYATHGYYPTSYSVTYDAAAKEYQVSLERLVAR